jgi:hypothetical protein
MPHEVLACSLDPQDALEAYQALNIVMGLVFHMMSLYVV